MILVEEAIRMRNEQNLLVRLEEIFLQFYGLQHCLATIVLILSLVRIGVNIAQRAQIDFWLFSFLGVDERTGPECGR